ncbi:RRM domain-containing protein [Plasmodiophora brassicae]
MAILTGAMADNGEPDKRSSYEQQAGDAVQAEHHLLREGGGGADIDDAENRTLFLGDVPAEATEVSPMPPANRVRSPPHQTLAYVQMDVLMAFCPYGDVDQVQIKVDRITKKPLGYGFVTFSTRAAAENAFSHQELCSQRIRIGWARKNHTLVLRNVGPAPTASSLEAMLGRFGPFEIEEILPGQSQCSVKFATRAIAERVREQCQGVVLHEGCPPCVVDWSYTNLNNVHVHFGKDRAVTDADLRDVFSKFGPVEKVVLPRHRNGSTKGFGFVYYPFGDDGERSAAAAIKAMNGGTLNGGVVICNYGHRQHSARALLKRMMSSRRHGRPATGKARGYPYQPGWFDVPGAGAAYPPYAPAIIDYRVLAGHVATASSKEGGNDGQGDPHDTNNTCGTTG